MATVDDIAVLRVMIAEPSADTYTDAALSSRIDAADGNLQSVAADIWGEKAGRYAELVDVTEGGSSRKMGDLHEQALNMAAHYRSLLRNPPGRGTRIVRLSR